MKFIEIEDFSNNNLFKNEIHNELIELLIEDIK